MPVAPLRSNRDQQAGTRIVGKPRVGGAMVDDQEQRLQDRGSGGTVRTLDWVALDHPPRLKATDNSLGRSRRVHQSEYSCDLLLVLRGSGNDQGIGSLIKLTAHIGVFLVNDDEQRSQQRNDSFPGRVLKRVDLGLLRRVGGVGRELGALKGPCQILGDGRCCEKQERPSDRRQPPAADPKECLGAQCAHAELPTVD